MVWWVFANGRYGSAERVDARSPARRPELSGGQGVWASSVPVGPEGAEGSGIFLEKNTVGIAQFFNVGKGGKESSQAGVLGWGMGVPVTEPSRGLCTWAAPNRSVGWPDS